MPFGGRSTLSYGLWGDHEVSFPRWTGRDSLPEAECQEAAFQEVWKRIIGASRTARATFAADTRDVHRSLLLKSTPKAFEYYAGNYRGASFPALVDRPASIKIAGATSRHVTRFSLACDVYSEMAILQSRIDLLRDAELPVVQHFFESVALFRRFSCIHPYLNGNGRISRLLLAALVSMVDLMPNESWTWSTRPYGREISGYFDCYLENPHLLTSYLAQWFT